MTIDDVLDRFVARELAEIGETATASAIQAGVITGGEVTYHHAVGQAQLDPIRAFGPWTPLDLASVTKVFTATLVMIAADRGRCSLESPIATWLPEWSDGPVPVTLMHLLNHSSGLPAWDQFYLRMPIQPSADVARQTANEIERQIIAKDRRPAGVHGLYSDLGYILLGRILERIWDRPLEEALQEQIAGPLGLSSIRYVSLRRGDAPLADAATTEVDPRRGGAMVGRVHDENCFIQGGVAGHAGLFGHALDVATFGQHLLAVDGGSNGIVSRDMLQTCWSGSSRGGDGHHRGGWDTPSGAVSSAGRGFREASTVGHLGFTGTSLWIERERGIVSVLLTNRVYPTRNNAMIKPLRVAFGEAVLPPEP